PASAGRGAPPSRRPSRARGRAGPSWPERAEVEVVEEVVPAVDRVDEGGVDGGEPLPPSRAAREGGEALEVGVVAGGPPLRVVARGPGRDEERPVGGLQHEELAGREEEDAPRLAAVRRSARSGEGGELRLGVVDPVPDPARVPVQPHAVVPSLPPG